MPEVTADLEKKSTLKIILHMDLEVVEDDDTLKTGDTIWLTFSERPYYIEGLLSGNAIETTINKIAEKLNMSYLENESKSNSKMTGPAKMHEVPRSNQAGKGGDIDSIVIYDY